MDIPQERKLVTEIPGPKSREWFERRDRAVPQGIANIHPIVTARAWGAIIEDVDGNRLIDFATGIAVLNVGHTSPEVVKAAQDQLERDTHTCFHVTANEPYIELAERLNALTPGDFALVTMSGTTSSSSIANQRPARPMPLWISSAMNTIPLAWQYSARPFRKPGAGTMKPPSPWMGSTITAAMFSSPMCLCISSRA